MPIAASELRKQAFLKCIIMGPPKIGKSTSIIATAPGPKYIITGDDPRGGSLNGAARRCDDFEYDHVKKWMHARRALENAKKGVAEKRYVTVVVDGFSALADYLADECLAETDSGNGPDGRRAWPALSKRLVTFCHGLIALPCHVFLITHFDDYKGAEIDNQLEKTGEGIMPLIPGQARKKIPGIFTDVFFFDYIKKKGEPEGKRYLVVNPRGVWGPGSRSLEGTRLIPANVKTLIKKIQEQALAAPKAEDSK